MKTVQSKILNNGDMSGNLESQVIDLADIDLGSIQAVFTGAPTGALKLQLSNQIVANTADPNVAVTEWTDYSGSATNVVAAGSHIFNISNMGYKWCKMVYTRTGGTGTLNATMTGKDA